MVKKGFGQKKMTRKRIKKKKYFVKTEEIEFEVFYFPIFTLSAIISLSLILWYDYIYFREITNFHTLFFGVFFLIGSFIFFSFSLWKLIRALHKIFGRKYVEIKWLEKIGK